jgi:hypothetical protein
VILSALRTELRSAIGNPSVASVANSALNDVLNEAYEHILDTYRFQNNRNICTFTTVASTADYALPTEYIHVLSVWDTTNSVRLAQRDDNWASDNLELDAGMPTDYVHYKNWIKLFPTPDDAYTIRVRHKATQTALSADGDEPVLPTPWHKGLVKKARAIWFENQGDVQKAAFFDDIWEKWVARKPIEVDEELMHDNEQGMIVPTARSHARRVSFDYSD